METPPRSLGFLRHLQIIEGLAGLATTFKRTAKNGLHVAEAVTYTSKNVIEALNGARRRLGPTS